MRSVRAEDIVAEIERQLGELCIVRLYAEQVLTQRTRRFELHAPARTPRVEVLHTLLGIELRIGKRRQLCPDLATARYLSVFARLGCDSVAVPYDITHISQLADQLESSWRRMMLLADHLTAGRSQRLRATVRRRLIEGVRRRIIESGAGTAFPLFNQQTRRTSS